MGGHCSFSSLSILPPMTKTHIVILLLWCRFSKFYSNWVCFAHLNVFLNVFFLDCFQIELKIVFSIAFSTCGGIVSLSWTHSDCHISNEKAKSICNCISHVLQVMSLSYLNNNINYHLCFSILCSIWSFCFLDEGQGGTRCMCVYSYLATVKQTCTPVNL